MPNCGDCGKPLSDNPGPNDCPSSVTHIPTCALARLRAENERLRAALEPFARWATQMDSPPNWVPDGCPIIVSPGDISDFCVGMLRRANAALAGKEKVNG